MSRMASCHKSVWHCNGGFFVNMGFCGSHVFGKGSTTAVVEWVAALAATVSSDVGAAFLFCDALLGQKRVL